MAVEDGCELLLKQQATGLSNGVRTNVPRFISAGTRIVVMTDDGSYVERAKD